MYWRQEASSANRRDHEVARPRRARPMGLLLSVLLVAGGIGATVARSQEFGLQQRKLTIGGAFVDALADFQRFGGDVDEVTPDELIRKGPKTVGEQHGRSIFAVGSGKPGEVVGIVTADGGAVKGSMTRDGFLKLQPASSGFLTRNAVIYQALYGKAPPDYTQEVVFEYVDDSGARLLLGGAETDKTTAYLFKKDPSTGEIIFRLQRDILKEKSSGSFLDPDVSSTFPTMVKFCDPMRANCVTRSIIKKPGDEIRFDPATRRVRITFNKDNLPYRHKYKTAQRLSWACEEEGRGFYFTYREGTLGGQSRPGRNDVGTLSCSRGVLKCERTALGQKCNFDFRDYLMRPAEAMLFGIDWLVSRKDPHTHYFTVAPDSSAKRHIRIGRLRNLASIKEVTLPRNGAVDPSGDGRMDAWVAQQLQQALCQGAAWRCTGAPAFKVIEVTSVNDGLDFIYERTSTKLKRIERARLYSLRRPYGWGKQGDFIGALITNKTEAASVTTLKRLNTELEAPDLLEKDTNDTPSDPVKAMLKGLKEEEKWEIMGVKLAKATQALVIFPTTHIEDLRGPLGFRVKNPPPVAAKILSLSPATTPRPAQPARSPRQPLPPTMPGY